MSVIVELALPADEFELGRILRMERSTEIALETMVPMGEQSVPFFRVFSAPQEDFEESVRAHPAVDDLLVVNTHDGETLYALDWHVEEDSFFRGVQAMEATILKGTGRTRTWAFDLRFPTHEALSDFQRYCNDRGIPITINRIYNPTKPGAGRWYGLTGPQREMLVRAVEAGYYSLPRQISTQELADEFGISDQAVTERLRRAIETLTTNTLLLSAEEDRSQTADDPA